MSIEKQKTKNIPLNRASIILNHQYVMTDYNSDKLGISLYSNTLEFIRNIYFNQDIIYSQIYKATCQEPFILIFSFDYDFEKSDIKLILVNLHNFSYICKNISELQEVYFTPIYTWNSREIIILDTNGEFYLINLNEELSIEKINTSFKNEIYKDFYQFAEVSKNFEVKKCYPEKLQFTYLDTQNNRAGLYDFKSNTTKTLSFSYPEDNYLLKPFDVIYRNEYFILTSYHALYVYKENNLINTINKYKKFRFYESSFLNDSKNEFVVISSDPMVMPGSTILKYKIVE